jgi:hypothetical protein
VANNLINVIMEALQKGGRWSPTFVIHKLFRFGVHGVSTWFQGTKTIRITKQINIDSMKAH